METALIKQIEALIASGKNKEARELLLEAGYGKQLDPDAQKAYIRLFPPSPELERQLEGSLKFILEGSLQERRGAAKRIESEARNEYHVRRAEWLADPRTTEILIRATNDRDPGVVEHAMIALGAINGRYFDDYRTLPVALRLMKSKRQFTRLWALTTARWLGGIEVYEQILPLCRDKAASVRCAALASAGGWLTRGKELPQHIAQAFLPPLLEALDDQSIDVRMAAVGSLRALGLPVALSRLKQALTVETHPLVKENLELAIRALS